MSFIKKIWGNKEEPIKTNQDFWNWFQKNEQIFFEIVKKGQNPEKLFFNKLSSKLENLNEGINFLCGMLDENTVELIFTPDGIIKNIVIVEDLVMAAPAIANWKFTALKPAIENDDIGIEMAGYRFDSNTISFYAIEHKDYPDEIDIVFAHNDFNEKNKTEIYNGTLIFLDNFLGEFNFVTAIDNVDVISKIKAEKKLIPIIKLKDYLVWREKEFVEKYKGVRYNTNDDVHAVLQAELQDGSPLIAVINTTLLDWDRKASHPWVLKVEIKFDGSENNGMPDKSTYKFLDKLEDEIKVDLKDFDGFLLVGRETVESVRVIYFACNSFRKPTNTLHNLSKKYSDKWEISFDIYKDKYWRTFDKFRQN